MGCASSKDTETTDQQNKPQPKDNQAKKDQVKKDDKKDQKGQDSQDQGKEEEPWACKDQAIRFVMKELNVSEEVATKIVNRANKDGDDKIEGNELRELWADIKEARDELHPMFVEADTNNTGKVSVGEASRILKTKYPKMDEKSMKKLLGQFEDGDGIIQYGEFILFYSYLKSADKDLRPSFEAADTGKTGVVTLTEARQCLGDKFPKLNEQAIKGLTYKYDSGDAKVNYQEFILLYANLKQAKCSLSRQFEQLDRNDDGKLSISYVTKIVMSETGMEEEECECLTRAADTSNDGNISKEEFLGMWEKFV